MVTVNAELQRKVNGTPLDWELAEDTESPTEVSDPVADYKTRRLIGRRWEPVEPFPFLIATAGDNVLLTPDAGDALQLVWWHVQAHPNLSGFVIVTVKVGTRDLYTFPLIANQPMMRTPAFDGDIDESIIVELSEAKQVFVNVEIRELVSA